MPIIGVDHVQLAMPAGGEDRARFFYHDVLGLPEQPKPPNLAKRGGCWFGTGAVRIHLGVDPQFHPATKAHPGLLVADLESMLRTCREHGLEIADAEPLDGFTRAYVSDPFGNRLELMQPDA
jgi:catechol 2,3-dioxygenase-like lactoylglutathione lyase family enzyme